MYFELFNKVSDIIKKLQDIQNKMEEIYVDNSDTDDE